MKQTVNFSQFTDAFKAIRPENFSYDGLCALFDYLEDYEDSMGEELELDVIALCCDFSEYDSAREASEAYGETFEEGEAREALEWLQDRTTVITIDEGDETGRVIVQNF